MNCHRRSKYFQFLGSHIIFNAVSSINTHVPMQMMQLTDNQIYSGISRCIMRKYCHFRFGRHPLKNICIEKH